MRSDLIVYTVVKRASPIKVHLRLLYLLFFLEQSFVPCSFNFSRAILFFKGLKCASLKVLRAVTFFVRIA